MITGKVTEKDLNGLDPASLVKLHQQVSIPLPTDQDKPSLVSNLMRHLNSLSGARTRNMPNYTVTVINGSTTARSIPTAQPTGGTGGCKTCG